MIIAYFIFSFPSLSCLLEFTSSVTTQNNSWYASISWKNRRTNIKVVFEWPYSGTRINGISSINYSFWRSLICSNLKSAWNKIFRWLKRLSGPKSKLTTKLSAYSFRDSTYSELLFIQNISPNPRTESASFFKRSPERVKAPSLNPSANQIFGFKNVRIRVDWALFSLVFLREVEWPSGQHVGPQAA